MAKARKQEFDARVVVDAAGASVVQAEASLDAVLAFRPGVYRHYKGGLYDAIGLCRHCEGFAMVLYRSRKHGSLNVRPLVSNDPVNDDAWNDLVNVGGDDGFVPRFEFVGPPAERSAV